jgi:hypothetical protein
MLAAIALNGGAATALVASTPVGPLPAGPVTRRFRVRVR